MDLISSLTSKVIDKALDGLARRHEATSSNLANAETPGYQRRSVTFEGALGEAIQKTRQRYQPKSTQADNEADLPMRTTNPLHFNIGTGVQSVEDVSPEVESTEGVEYKNDGNSVDLETEMAQLAKNTEHYIALTKFSGIRGRTLRSVINSGGGG